MMELYEANLLWPESCTEHRSTRAATITACSGDGDGEEVVESGRSTWTMAMTAAVDVPKTRGGAANYAAARKHDSKEEEEEEEMVPPHVVVSSRSRAMGGEAAFSVFVGHGRTLKGRDLCHFRDTVLRLTGFLEA
ncbi:hypothetical protein Cni_G04419 [Canna indica]|uniref:Uncharacterized protein n=1 Tax=Canna indica TaxID=4628 RepID=A0AAQ3JTF9_9LILI|nr:hypothetical protein Cni_G04419 [Canna indica]